MAEILVTGSAVVDMVFGVRTFPTRAEKYQAETVDIVGGGCAANAAVGIARLGGQARILCRCADDAMGRAMLADLVAEGVDTALAQVSVTGRSAFSSIYVDAAGERQIMAFRGDGLAEDVAGLDLGVPDAVLADTRWPQAAVAGLTLARRRGVPGVLDGEAPVQPDLVRLASHVGFSAQGLRDFTGLDDLAAGLAAAATRTDAWLCVTDGADGTLERMPDGTTRHWPAPDVAVVDTLGAGDIWHGAFALRLAEGGSPAEAIRFATAAASLKCTRPGGRSGAPGRDETIEFMQGMKS